MEDEEWNELLQAYIEEYDLANPSVPGSYRKTVLHLVEDLRQFRRQKVVNPVEKFKKLESFDLRISRISIFRRIDHEGSERLMVHLRSSLEMLRIP